MLSIGFEQQRLMHVLKNVGFAVKATHNDWNLVHILERRPAHDLLTSPVEYWGSKSSQWTWPIPTKAFVNKN